MLYQQPQSGPLQVDTTNPLAQGLVFCSIPIAGGFYEVFTAQATAHPGTFRARASVDGDQGQAVSAIGTAATGGKFANATGMDAISGAFSLFIEGSLEVNGSTQALIISRETSAGNGFGVKFDDAAIVTNGFFYYANNGNQTNSGFDVLNLNSEKFTHRVLLTADGSTSKFYAKRALVNSPASATLPTASANRRTTMCGMDNAQGSGSIALAMVWNRVLSLAEYQAIYDNPWQLFVDFDEEDEGLFPVAGGPRSYSYTGTGGMTFSGSAAILRAAIKTPAGGIAFAGSAASNRGVVKAVAGGISFSGTATQTRGAVRAPSGGITFAGAATIVRSRIKAAVGGIQFAGAAAVTFFNGVQSLVVTPVGGIVFGGAAAFVRTCTRLVAGGISFAGAAGVVLTHFGAVVGNWVNVAKHRRRN